MAFNINAQVVLSGPKNLSKISKQIQQGIGKSGAIKVAVDPRSLRNIRSLNTTVSNLNNNISSLNKSATTLRSTLSSVNNGLSKANSSSSAFNKNQQQTASSVNNVNKALQQQSATLGTLGKRFLSTAKTAIAFGLISRPIYDLQRAFVGATKDAVQFQREIVKISQVTGTSVQNLTGLSNEINKLATTLGVSANELAETSRIIAQTGRSAAEIQPILNALARSTLAPTFGKITDTTEGLIAALGQFQLEAGQSEVILGSLNKVSKSFAVEAEDLISVIRRTGGVFAQAAGDSRNTVQALQELAAIFTAVRSTTRESADTIAAGLRTIFSRIQRRGTIEFLEQFGVQLTNVKGEFIGIFPAFDELSTKLSTLIKQGDALTLSAIAEELGGIRQIGKLLPAIAQFDKARAALEQAQKGAVEGLGVDVAKGLDTVDNRIKRVKESFDELIRTVFESDSFQNFTKGVLSSAETILQFGTKVVEALEPILPLLQGIGAVKLGQALGGFVGGGGIGKVAGGLSGQAAAQASQLAAKATQSNTQILTTINTTLQRSSNQLSNIFQSLEGNFRTLTTQMSNLIQAIGSFSSATRASSVAGFAGGVRRRSGGGKILGFNRGGIVPGTGNSDTVPAMLTPGEFVIRKSSVESIGASQLASMNKFNRGGKAKGKGKRAYVFDFDDTLGVSGSSGKELFSSDPQLAAARQDKLRNARATSLANSARKRSQQGYDVHVLTARFGSPQDEAALRDFLTTAGIKPGRTIFTGGLFKGEREPGKRPGTTRQLSTATKKARILEQLSAQYDSILFLDDAIENVVKAKGVKGVTPIAVNKKTQGLRRKFQGGGPVNVIGTFGQNSVSKEFAIQNDPYALTKEAGKNFLKVASGGRRKNRFGPDDEFEYGLKTIGLDPLQDKRISNPLKNQYVDAAKKNNSKLRGEIFEKMAAEAFKFKLSQNQARLDGSNRAKQLFEVKSVVKTVGAGGVSKKVLGAALGVGTVTDKADDILKNKLTAKRLTTQKDKVNFGSVSLIEDTQVLKSGKNLTKALTQAEKSKFKTLQKKEIAGKFDDGIKGTAERRKLGQFRAREFSDVRSRLQNRASGGAISGQDTVPALLTPGEFVFNKESAGRIGYSTLNAMNKKGVQGFNKGGVVGYNNGGFVGSSDFKALQANQKASFEKELKRQQRLKDAAGDNNDDAPEAGNALGDLAGVALSASFAVQSLTASFEDGKFTIDELFNSALLLAPVIPAISSTIGSLKPSFEKFKTELRNTRGVLGKTRKVLSGTGGRIAAGAGALAGAALTTVEGEGTGAITARGAGAGLAAGFGAAAVGIPAPIAAVIGLSAGLFSTLDGLIKSASPLPNALNELSKSTKEAAANLDKISVKDAGNLSAKIFEDVGDVLSAQTQDLTLAKSTQGTANLIGSAFTSESAEVRGVAQGLFADVLGGIFTGQVISGPQQVASNMASRLAASSAATRQEIQGSFTGDDIATSFEDVDKIAAPAVKALTKALSEIDSSPAETIDEFRTILDNAGVSADNANTILTTVSKTGLNDLTDRLSDFKDETSGVQNRINGLLTELARSDNVEDFNSKLKELDSVLQSTGEESLKDFSAESIVTGAALDTLNGTLNTSEKTILQVNEALNKFNNNLTSITDELSFGLNKISTQTDNFQKRVNAIFAGTGELTIGRSVSGFAAGAGEADRAASFAKLGAAATGDISGLETVLRGVQDLPSIGEEFLRGSQASATSPKTFAENFATFFKGRLPGVEVPDALVNSIESAVKGEQSRQGGKAIVPREAFKNILEGDLGKQISELGGKAGEALDNTAKKIDEASNAVAEALEKEVNFRLQILSKQRQVEEKLISQQENRASRLSTLRGETVDPLAQATSSQAGQLSRLGFAGGDVSSVSAARDKALKEQEAASKDITSATQAGKDKLLELADEVARSTEALKILGDQSKTLAAIEAKAAELKRQEQLQTAGIDQLVGEAVTAAQQGDPRALLQLENTIQALDAAARGEATQQQAAIAKQFAGTAAGQALLGGEEQAQALQSTLTDQFSGQFQKLFKGSAFAKSLEVLGKRREDSRFEQRVEAERFRAVAEQEQAAGRASADIDNAAIAAAESRAATEDPSQVFSNAVDSFAKAVGVFIAPPAPTPTAPPLAPGAIPTPSAPAVKGPSGIELAAQPEKFGLAGRVGGAIGQGLGAASGFVASMFQRGPAPEPPSQLDQIRNANRVRFQRQQIQRRAAAGIITPEEAKQLSSQIKDGSEQGANIFAQIFNSFAEKLPEQINAVLEPVQIVGTDSMGEAIGQQLLPQIEKMLQSMLDPNEGLENPAAGAGIN